MYKKKEHKFSNRIKCYTVCASLLLVIVGITIKKEKEIVAATALEIESTICKEEELKDKKILEDEWDGLNPQQNAFLIMEELGFDLTTKKIIATTIIDENKDETKEGQVVMESTENDTNQEELKTLESKSTEVNSNETEEVDNKVQETIQLANSDFDTLVRIVEAEATGEDIKGKILVANVILNRVNHESFPNSVRAVVFETCGGSPQFSPTADGRYDSVNISEDSKEAVNRALSGEDYSDGALYFSARSRAEPTNMSWFDRNLQWLFKYGGHEFYALKD